MMKSVDVIDEFPEEFLFIELKKYRPMHGGMEFRCPLSDDKHQTKTRCPLYVDDDKRGNATVKRIARDELKHYGHCSLSVW